jgi:hypothetical protein
MTIRPPLIQIDPRHALLAGQACRSGWRIIFIVMHFHACVMYALRLPKMHKQRRDTYHGLHHALHLH